MPAEERIWRPGVSVPLRGKGRDQQADKPLNEVFQPRFPSPCGEKVGINLEAEYRAAIERQVSVPLRGKGRDQQTETPMYSV